MKILYVDDDKGYYIVEDNSSYPAGHEIKRGPFQNEQEARKGLETYAKTGKWPEYKKSQDV